MSGKEEKAIHDIDKTQRPKDAKQDQNHQEDGKQETLQRMGQEKQADWQQEDSRRNEHHRHHHHHKGHQHHSRMKKRKFRLLAGAAVLLGVLFLIFIGTTVHLYKQKQANEAEMAARRTGSGIFSKTAEDAAENAAGNTGKNNEKEGNIPDDTASNGADGLNEKASELNANNLNHDKYVSEKNTKTDEMLLLNQNHVEYNGKTYSRSTYLKAYLIIGIDRKGKLTEKTVTGKAGQADGVFLAVHNTSANTAAVVQIPRDTMTPITLTDLSGNVLGQDKQAVSLSFAYGDGREQSCAYTVKAVSDLLCGLPIDGYFAVSTDVISLWNDMIGGVDVQIEEDGLEKANPAFVKGRTVHFSGDMAERFVRYRDTTEAGSPLVRMGRQRRYMMAFETQLQKQAAANDALIPQLFDAAADYMLTDMEKGTYLRLAMDMAQSQKLSDADFYQIPGTAGETQFYDEFYPDQTGIMELMLRIFYHEAK